MDKNPGPSILKYNSRANTALGCKKIFFYFIYSIFCCQDPIHLCPNCVQRCRLKDRQSFGSIELFAAFGEIRIEAGFGETRMFRSFRVFIDMKVSLG